MFHQYIRCNPRTISLRDIAFTIRSLLHYYDSAIYHQMMKRFSDRFILDFPILFLEIIALGSIPLSMHFPTVWEEVSLIVVSIALI